MLGFILPKCRWDLEDPIDCSTCLKVTGTHCLSEHSYMGLPRWCSCKESTCQCRRLKKHRFDPGSGRSSGPQSRGSERVGHDWVCAHACVHTHTHTLSLSYIKHCMLGYFCGSEDCISYKGRVCPHFCLFRKHIFLILMYWHHYKHRLYMCELHIEAYTNTNTL